MVVDDLVAPALENPNADRRREDQAEVVDVVIGRSRNTGLAGIQTMSSGYFRSRNSEAVSKGMKTHSLSGVL